jgi:hypothetical protein
MAIAACGGDENGAATDVPAAQRAVPYRLYWAGPNVAGLSLTDVLRGSGLTTFIYGTCTPKPAGDEASCSPPLEIQVASICDRNALLLDVRPRSRFAARGATVFDYGDRRLEVSVGESEIVIWAAPRLARQAIASLQPAVGRRVGALPPARFPRSYLAQLQRVRAAYARTRSVRAVRDELHISQSAVRLELRLAAAPRTRPARCP